MDYAPDDRYYVSDIGRVWPVNGKYTPQQRELLQFVLEFHKAVMLRIRAGVTATQIHDEAKKAMEPAVREENLYLRFEDTIVVTETGYENFTQLPADGARRHGASGARKVSSSTRRRSPHQRFNAA